MHIVVDKKNPLVAETFRQFGDVRALSTQEITRASVREADIIIIRSETKVTEELLEGSSVRFVGTATIGTDHVDVEYLHEHGIGFTSAPGSNANSVAEYVVAALLTVAKRKGFALEGKTLGVVGVGNVGSKVVWNAKALGMKVLQNDPPLFRANGNPLFHPLDDLMHADIISLHVPLTRGGTDPTLHLFDSERIGKLKKGAILFNTARGSVVDGAALALALRNGHLGGAVLDVWEREPLIDLELMKKVDIATPHIAGYSFDGKLAAVKMLYAAACKFFGRTENWELEKSVPQAAVDRITVPTSEDSAEEVLRNVVNECYDIERDDRSLRAISTVSEEDRRTFFPRLRASYGVRREFFNTTVELPDTMASLTKTLTSIGFKVEILDPREIHDGWKR